MTVRELFLDRDCNCAETILLWASQWKERYRRPDVRCLYVVEHAAAVLDQYMKPLEDPSHA